jgi:hypothetical protein
VRVPEELDVALVELTDVAAEERRAAWDRLCAEAKASGHGPGWAGSLYKDRFGAPPPRSFAFPREPREFTEEEKRAYFAELEDVARTYGYRRSYAVVRYREKFGEIPPIDFDAPRMAATREVMP